MFDIFHEWGCDLRVGSSGDLALAIGSDAVSQRVVRRLLTNPRGYIWNLDYGGGLAQFVGTPAASSNVEAVVNVQLAMESAIPQDIAPRVSVSVVNAADGYVVADIIYADPFSAQPVAISVTAGRPA